MKTLFFIVLFLLVTARPTFAQEELIIDPLSPTPTPEVNYTMPYPGILPDNPLYALKATRDRVISFFISDPIKKAEFDLLQADKRVQAGLALLHNDRPNAKLAISTISKGQNYFEEAIVALRREEATTKNKTAVSPTGTTSLTLSDVPDKLYNAARKHTELLQKEQQSIPSEQKTAFRELIKRSERLSKEAKLTKDNK